ELKYDYIVAPHADYQKIKFEIKGADAIELLQDGALLIRTPLGNIYEGAPLCFQNGKHLVSKWVLNGNMLSFEIENHDPTLELIIDPVTRLWGTYYGGTGADHSGYNHGYVDASGNAYLGGMTATAGG